MNNKLSHTLEIAIDIARKGGEILKSYWGNIHQVRNKSYIGDLVTEADEKSEVLIVSELQVHFPDHQILAEESGYSSISSDWMWVIDPLDGTTNYMHQFPFVAISIGLLYQNKPVLGVIYNPIIGELFTGAKGLGAYCGRVAMHVSKISSLEQSLLATGFPYDRNQTSDNNYAQYCRFTSLSQGVRRMGSAALDLAYVAAGRLDGYWERGIKPWDIAAGAILVEEAGGKVTDYNLDPLDLGNGRILASNGALHALMSQEL